MATPKSMKSFRSWSSVDSVDPNDVRHLCEAESDPSAQKPSPGGRCVSTWTFSLIVLIISVFLLVGIFVGYYIRDGKNYSVPKDVPCDFTFRTDGFGPDRLEMIHENVMYLMSGERVRDTAGDMTSKNSQKSDSTLDKKMVKYISEHLKNSGLDKVETVKYIIEVTSPDPENPSSVTLTKNDQEILTLKYGSKGSAGQDNTIVKEEDPLIAVPGRAVGNLVYGFYGRRQDLYFVKKANITLKKNVLLLKIGRISILEKLRLAALEEVSGILLYQDPSDSPTSREELYFVSHQLNNKNFQIPIQVVSNRDAESLLKSLRNEGVIAPEEWKTAPGGIRQYMGIIPNKTISPVVVDLRVNVVQKEEVITVVIGSIYGDMEPDRFVVIGASREDPSESDEGDENLGLGTAHLLEMAQAFANIKYAEKWGPRRGVRFCSWGGGKEQKGLIEYLKANRYVFGAQTLAYIDLDLYIEKSLAHDAVFEASSSPALNRLIQHVLHQVPHPEDKQLTIADWQYNKPVNQFVSHGNLVVRNMLHRLGVPVVSVAYRVSLNSSDEETSAVLQDSLHHDQYHLAASRVISLVALHLVDDNHLPLNMINYTKFIHDVFARSLVDLSDAKEKVNVGKLQEYIDDLTRIGKAFENYVTSEVYTQIPLGSRRMNDIKMGVDKIMISPADFLYTSPLLYATAPDGSSYLIKEAISSAKISNDWTEVQRIVKTVNRAVQEVMSYLQLS
ncbi:aminopeptidase NAALADL1-like [Saccostrea echinata]|uniref:aminopeptidase NAALADL1-like n=1 Tax=Saccostrea echinata TaxID=191078 RepID=UPI002A81F399|nr:aminopeptidase NAALADL1-like [Saccostrea echinata]